MKLNKKYSNIFKRLGLGLTLCFFFFTTILSLSKTANAGLISFFNTVLGGEQVSAKSVRVSVNNSQTMALLPQPAVNVDPNPDKYTEVVPVVDGGILVPDIASANISPVEYSSKISVYTVHEGDTVSGIAKMFNVSVNTVLWANNLNSKSVLRAGQTLVILPVTGIKYTVQKGDTVSSIANKYKADAGEIYSYNDLNSSADLVVGQSIIIPDAEIGVPITTSIVRSLNGMIVPNDPVTVNVKSLPFYPGYYSCPVIGRLSQGLHGRNSVDLAAPIGTPLRASADGTITISKSNGTWNGGYGNYVVISHSNNTQTLYGHMLKTIVNPGDQVKKGQIIGYIGISGMTTGPHVHFEVRGARNPFTDNSCN